ncbi:MAG TPA: ribose 5-phosphate isomerase A [Ktedonobacterales bacterium]
MGGSCAYRAARHRRADVRAHPQPGERPGYSAARARQRPRPSSQHYGADEVVLPALQLVKGHGGALLREKLVAASSHTRIIIVDQTKLVDTLGARHPLPVEVIPFGWVHTAQTPAQTAEPQPYLTDSGNYILDCATGPITDPYGLAQAIKAQVGVVEHGLFVGMTEKLYVGGPDGVRTFTAGG